VKRLDRTQQSRSGAPWRPNSHGEPDGPPDRTGPLRRPRSLNARTARCVVFMAPIVLTACQSAVLDPQGPVGLAQKMILIDSLAIMLAIVIPTIAATFAFAWWFRASNTRARYLPDWVYSGRIELITWSIPTLVVMLLGGVTWIASHELDPAKPLASNNHRSKCRPSRSIGSGSSFTRARASPLSTSLWSLRARQFISP